MRQVFEIEKILPEREIETTKLNGQNDKMLVIGVVMVCAGASMFAEMFGETAKAFKSEGCDKGTTLIANVEFKARSWQNAAGGTSYGTNVRILDFTIIKN